MRILITTQTNKGLEHSGFAHIASISDIDAKVQPASVTELVADDVLDEWQPREPVLNSLLSKLRKGGRISFTGVDLEEVTRALMSRTITVPEANHLLFRNNNKSAVSLELMLESLISRGLKVMTARIQGFQYMITAVRDGN
jgi:hypothetical protein